MNLAANWVYLIGFELAIALLVACLILLGHGRSLRKLIAALEAKILSLRDAGRKRSALFEALKDEITQLRNSAATGYTDQLQEQLDATRNRHLALSPERDIVLDIAPDTPLDRQSLALRHAFLIAEQEAALAADGKGVDWSVLEAKLGQIIQFYQQPPESLSVVDELEVDSGDIVSAETDSSGGAHEETIANQKRHIANLEKFRNLYFDVERKWREARAEAEKYHQELMALGNSLGGGEEFQQLLKSYGDVYGGLDGLLEGGGQNSRDESPAAPTGVGRIVIANQEEVQRLRNMAVDQHKVILALKKQLSEADTLEQKDRVIEEMHAQLERNERFLQESDTCLRQLESELSRLLTENEELKVKLESMPSDPATHAKDDEAAQEIEMLRGLVASFTEQSRDMLGAIAVLEEDNRRLMTQAGDGAGDTGAKVAELSEKLGKAQQELLNLQAQHIELEERYLELKMQAD